MNTESDLAITRVTVVLDSPGDWTNWLFIRKDSCRRNDLWKFVDPDISSDKLPKLQEPSEPQITLYNTNATSLAQLEREQRESFRWEYDQYERKLQEYRKTAHALAEFNLEISKTISKRRLYLIQDCESAHQRLVALKKHLAPDAATRRHELTRRYNDLRVGPSSFNKVEQWLAEWTQVVAMGKSIKLPETEGIRPQEDFLVACRKIDQEYATTCLRDIYKAENAGLAETLPSLDDYIAEFTAFLRRNKTSPSTVTVAAAELELTTSIDKDTGADKSRQSKQTPVCICGMRHWYSDCFILNTNHPKRPAGYTPTKNALNKVKEARKDPKIEARIIKALDRWSKKHQDIEPLKLDDGLPPSTTNTFVSCVALIGEINPQESQDQYNDTCVIKLDHSEYLDEQHTTLALENDYSQQLLTRWIVDPGSNTHVINSEKWKGWTRERENTENRTVNAGNSQIPITAWGRFELVARTPTGNRTLQLTHVAFVESFLTSVIGLARCRGENIHFDSGRDLLYKNTHNNVVAQLEYNGGHWLIDADESRRPNISNFERQMGSFGTLYRPSYIPKTVNRIDRLLAHQIWGHPSKKAIRHLMSNVKGIELSGEDIQDCRCEVCAETRLTRIISRRTGEDRATRPFYRIGIDIIYIVPISDHCWNGDKYMLHAVDEFSKWHEVSTVRNKTKSILMRWIMGVIRKIQRVFDTDICAIRSDNESGFGNDLIELCNDLGIIFESTAVACPEQNGLAERAGKLLTARARAMRIQGNLPMSLVNELYKTSAYIVNRTPTESLGWKTPYEIVWSRQPVVSHLQPIGCRAYVLNHDVPKGDKTSSRALIGHLIGYQGTNLFRIWLPKKDDVVVMRDVLFDNKLFFESLEGYAKGLNIQKAIEVLEYPQNIESDDVGIEELLTHRQRKNNRIEVNTSDDASPDTRNDSRHKGLDTGKDCQDILDYQVPTPDPSEIGEKIYSDTHESNTDTKEITRNNKTQRSTDTTEDYRAHGEIAPRDINLNPFDRNLILTSKRTRKKALNPNVFAISTYTSAIGESALSDYLNTFALETSNQCWNEDVPRVHQNQLPCPPRSVKACQTHQFGRHFMQALHKEWNSLLSKGCFRKIDKVTATADAEILPLMWIFSYKTCEDGYLASFKARLVVRGDLEEPLENTYAATLAIRNFRALIAISNYFDLELKQYDVPTAFLNAKLNRKLYAQIPDGLEHKEGEILEVLLALYGLKESPLLWYRELEGTLLGLGLRATPGFPCLYVNDWLILFVYVDDIVMAYHHSNEHLQENFESKLIQMYNLKTMGNITWFLGIRVLRDRKLGKSWLVQDAYIEKVCARFGIECVGRYPELPLTENWLPQSNEEPDKSRTKLYQQLIGSLAYIAVWGRPDVARTHVVLACHLTNPGQSHISKAKQVWRYLLGTKAYALEASVTNNQLSEYINDDITYKDPLFFGSSDASFADEAETRRSSQGYIFKFGGMAIDWKSTVQRTITKSTTESELLSLSLAGSQMEEWVRFFKGLSLTLDSKPVIWCDNQQTVGIVSKAQDKLHTKVKHVDIHQLWVRQEVEASRLDVVWVPTDRMPADGLTKILPKQKFSAFVKQLGLVDISARLLNEKSLKYTDMNILYPNRS